MSTENKQDLLDTPLHGVYIPAALLIVGVAIVKSEWVGYAILATVSLALFKLWRGRKCLKTLIANFLLTAARTYSDAQPR